MDVFRTALRGPNLLQNLLGEQSLSASFIPIYSRMIAENRRQEAGRFAGAIFGLLLALSAALALVGVALAEPVVMIVAPGYLSDASLVAAGSRTVDRFPLAVSAVRIMFPMAGVLVLSAWSLGVLNSHRRFFLPYMAPALWNASIVAALVVTARILGLGVPAAIDASGLDSLLIAACIGALVGGVLQFLVQIPLVIRCLTDFKVSISHRVKGVRQAITAFVPLLAGRGAVQLSSYLDLLLASFLVAGALAALGWAQTLYLLPIGLFGMSVAAAELPELSRTIHSATEGENLDRLRSSLSQVAFLTVPTAIGYLGLGFLIIAALFRRGNFGLADNWLVYAVLCGYSVGLVPSTSSRLLNNLFFAQGLTRVPARIGIERVILSGVVGASLMIILDRYSVNGVIGVDSVTDHSLHFGAVGLALGAGLSSWFEFWRLRRALTGLMIRSFVPWRRVAAMTGLSLVSLLAAAPVWWVSRGLAPSIALVPVFIAYTLLYLVGAGLLGWPELKRWYPRAGAKTDDRSG
jgi:putative peptidoglycan lipid II flippase